MFWRILWQLLGASRGRLALALIALASGAAVCSALLNVDLDAQRKLTREFRTLGANLVVAPAAGDAGGSDAPGSDAQSTFAVGEAMPQIDALGTAQLVAAAPYLYIAAKAGGQPVILAGTWFDQLARMNSWWKVDGAMIGARDDRANCLLGITAARQLGLSLGSAVELRSGAREISLTVKGIVSSGGDEDSQIFTSLAVAQELSGQDGRAGMVQLSVAGRPAEIEAWGARLARALPQLEVRPVRQLAAAEGSILGRIQGLMFWTITLILTLSTLGVLASMAALAMERSKDVGLMKALGGPVPRIMRLFLTEAGALGISGGIIGFLAGIVLARWIGELVFGVSISPRLIVFPITLVLTVAAALAGAMPLRLLGRVRPAEILRGE